eukprot:scaffold1052_cov339-Pavlova_lutheri.AAC.38
MCSDTSRISRPLERYSDDGCKYARCLRLLVESPLSLVEMVYTNPMLSRMHVNNDAWMSTCLPTSCDFCSYQAQVAFKTYNNHEALQHSPPPSLSTRPSVSWQWPLLRKLLASRSSIQVISIYEELVEYCVGSIGFDAFDQLTFVCLDTITTSAWCTDS